MTATHLSALTLAQFRSHALTRLSIDARPVALFGANGAGKTNLLEAVSLLSPGRGLRRARPEELARAPGALGWRARATLAGRGDPVEVALTGPPEGGRRVEIDGRAAPQTALGALVPMLWLTPAMDRLFIEGAEGRRRGIDRAALGFEPAHAEAAQAYDRAMRERSLLLRDGPRDARWLDALEARMAEAGAAVARARATTAARLNAAQEGGAALFPTAQAAMVGKMEARFAAAGPAGAEASEIMEEFRISLARGRRDDAAAGRALAGPHRSDLAVVYAEKEMDARLCSTGEQKALLIGLTLAAARAMAADRGTAPILLLDEVAAHLDAARRAALYDALCELGAQSWLSATEPGLFAGLGDRAQGFEVTEGPDGSTVRAAALA